jgi:CRP/FNR family cyclic AMP-dependent transcriptional regulator
MLGLKRHAEAYGEQTPDGVRLNIAAPDLAREVGANEADVLDVIMRLQRLRIAWEDEIGSIVVADVGRLLEFMEFLEMPRRFEAS